MGLWQQYKTRKAEREFNRLLAQLKSSDVIGRNVVVKTLEQMGDKRAIPALIKVLPVSGVSHAAAKALVTLGWRPEDPHDAAIFHAVHWSGDRLDASEVKRLVAEGHGKLVTEALGRELAGCSNHYCAERAAKFIGEIGSAPDDVIRVLIAYIWLGDLGDQQVQIACANTLAKLGDKRVVADLKRAPANRPWNATQMAVGEAVQALEEIDNKDSISSD